VPDLRDDGKKSVIAELDEIILGLPNGEDPPSRFGWPGGMDDEPGWRILPQTQPSNDLVVVLAGGWTSDVLDERDAGHRALSSQRTRPTRPWEMITASRRTEPAKKFVTHAEPPMS
jgi:hypothetical protein